MRVKTVILLSLSLLQMGCAAIMTGQGRPEPNWPRRKPHDRLFYYGVGGPAKTLKEAKEEARKELAKAIELEVEGVVKRIIIERGEEIESSFLEYTRTYVKRKLPEPVIIDSYYKQKEGYYALARVSRALVERMVEESVKEIRADVRDRMDYAEKSLKSGRVIDAIREYELAYRKALMLPRKYDWLDEEGGRRLTFHLERRVRALADGMAIKVVSGDGQEGSYGSPLPKPISIQVSCSFDDEEIPVNDLPIRIRFDRGKGRLKSANLSGTELVLKTDRNGSASLTVEKVLSVTDLNRLSVRIDGSALTGLKGEIGRRLSLLRAYITYPSELKGGDPGWRPAVLINGSSGEQEFEEGDKIWIEVITPRDGNLYLFVISSDGRMRYLAYIPMMVAGEGEGWRITPHGEGWRLRMDSVRITTQYGKGVETVVAFLCGSKIKFDPGMKLPWDGLVRTFEGQTHGKWGVGWISYLIK